MTRILILLSFSFFFSYAQIEDKFKSENVLSKKGQKTLEKLLSLQNNQVEFDALLQKISATAEYETVLILTYTLFELPWDLNLIPQHSHDLRMPKVRVENQLDKLVAAKAHDKLSALYFRSLSKNKAKQEEAQTQLLKWTITQKPNFEWQGNRFVLKTEESKPKENILKKEGKTLPKVHWIDVQSIGFEIIEDKQEIALSPEIAKKIFLNLYPKFSEEWQSVIQDKIEKSPKAYSLPDSGKFKNFFRPTKDKEKFAIVLRYSKESLIVKILEPQGSYLWHHYYECLATFNIKRSKEIDQIFNIAKLDKTFGRVYKGVKQGSSPAEVINALGKPTETRITQAMGFYFWYYVPEKITIIFQGERVKEIQDDVPAHLTEEK